MQVAAAAAAQRGQALVPRSRRTVPGCTPASIFDLLGSSSVGTSTVVPSAASVKGMSTRVSRSSPWRSKRGSGGTVTAT